LATVPDAPILQAFSKGILNIPNLNKPRNHRQVKTFLLTRLLTMPPIMAITAKTSSMGRHDNNSGFREFAT
jgi:hypothetical protein